MTLKSWSMLINSDTVVVFDLDDTLYAESIYRKSGIKRLLNFIETYYPNTDLQQLPFERLLEADDFLALICEKLNLPSQVKESFLWLYRLHEPNIELSANILSPLTEIKKRSRALAILTDGRSVTQRLKLKALGLLDLPQYISEEHSSEKPNLFRFEKIMFDYPDCAYLYIGDNPQKDFIAPNILGWCSVCIRGDPSNIHSQEYINHSEICMPKLWINSLTDLIEDIKFL